MRRRLYIRDFDSLTRNTNVVGGIMTFNSYQFILLFLPIALIGSYVCVHFKRNWKKWLLAISLVFYACNGVKYLPFIIVNIVVNYLFYKQIISKKIKAKSILWLAVFCNVIVLIIFKYLNFIIDILNALHIANLQTVNIAFPTGISFITFQQIAFLVDAYKNPEERYTLLDYSIFVSYFPHIISGPIVYSHQFFPLLDNKTIDWGKVSSGIYLFAIGLSKKVLIADPLAGGVDYAYGNLSSINGSSFLLASIMYSLQLYFDFSGYSDMAIGIARMMGLDLPVNFNSPYKADSISDFWNRWHITLTWFLTHYIYIPLGGNRKGKTRTYLNIFIVFLISGLWHGASYTFIVWGMLHGIALIIYKIAHGHIRIPKFVGRIMTLVFVNFTWILFRAGSVGVFKQAVNACLYGGWGNLDVLMCKASLPRYISMYLTEDAPDMLYVLLALSMTIVLFVITQAMKNSQEIVEKAKYSVLDSVIIIILGVASLLSLTGVSHFIYAYF